MKIGRKEGKSALAGRTAGGLWRLALPPRSHSAATAPASIHGHVNNAAGRPGHQGRDTVIDGSELRGAKDRKYQYTFPIERTGTTRASGIAPGNYVVFVFQEDKSLDFNESVVFADRRRQACELRHVPPGVHRQDVS